MTSHSCIISTQDQDNCEDDIDCWEDRHLQPHPLNVSRLSVCSGSSIYVGAEDDNFYGDGNCSYQAIEEDLSRLSTESFDGDGYVDKEFSDQEKRAKESLPSELLFSDSDKEPRCYSFSGESEGPGSNSTCGAGLVVITRPKGGRRALCMDLDEVKACRDLGFEMEHERMLELPSASRVSLSTTSNLDTASSGGNSPIANWLVSLTLVMTHGTSSLDSRSGHKRLLWHLHHGKAAEQFHYNHISQDFQHRDRKRYYDPIFFFLIL